MWKPPDQPNPSEIMNSAASDTLSGLHEQALEKFVWYHKNSLAYSRLLDAERLSFALGYWWELAKVYPPARDAFLRTRDETEAAFRNAFSKGTAGWAIRDIFLDIVALNSNIGDQTRTADLFEFIVEKDPWTAPLLYSVAEDSLLAAGRFKCCEPFLDWQPRIASAAATYRVSLALEEEWRKVDPRLPPATRNSYMRDVARLLALLVVNNRVNEAKDAYAEALLVVKDEEIERVLNAAMSGHLPSK